MKHTTYNEIECWVDNHEISLCDIRLDYKENLLLMTRSTLKLATSNEKMHFLREKKISFAPDKVSQDRITKSRSF